MAEVLESVLKNSSEHLQKICDIICNVSEKDLNDADIAKQDIAVAHLLPDPNYMT